MKVIALKGYANNGKTETLNYVYQFLLAKGYTQLAGHFEVLGNPKIRDFMDVLEDKEKTLKVGFATMGDFSRKKSASVKDLLAKLETKGCDIAVCACRTDLIGTIKAVKSYPNHIFIDKLVSTTVDLERIVNHADASNIISQI